LKANHDSEAVTQVFITQAKERYPQALTFLEEKEEDTNNTAATATA